MNTRFAKLAELLVGYSTKIALGDVVVIECYDIPQPMIEALIISVQRAGGHPIVWQKSWTTLRTLLMEADAKAIDIIAEAELQQMKQASVYISLRASNDFWLNGVPREKIALFQTHWLSKVHYRYRVHYTRWCSSKWPTASLAQMAGVSIQELENLYFQFCLGVDYERLSAAMDPLADLINRTNVVRITSPGTDISFSIKDIGAKKCAGDCNLPDGEVFTAPVKESVNGEIYYNVPSIYQGQEYIGVQLSIREGLIVSADCHQGSAENLNAVLDTDQGARYIGEFAFGVNPMISSPMRDTMFDEKMSGSIHLTPGNSYRATFNGNESGIHWDLVLNQTEQYGGGNVYFDDILIRQNGIFVLPALAKLNPQSLTL